MALPRTRASATIGKNDRRACRLRRASGAAREEQTPVGRNPRSETHLKKVGRQREEQIAKRLRKPASGTVADDVGVVGAIPAKPEGLSSDRQDVDSLFLMRCRDRKTPREVPKVERLWAGTSG